MRLTDIGLSLPTILIAVVMVAVSSRASATSSWSSRCCWRASPADPRRDAGDQGAGLRRAGGGGRTVERLDHLAPHLPNVVPTLLVISTLQGGLRDPAGGHLSFLGVACRRINPAWGLMIADGRASWPPRGGSPSFPVWPCS
jgi:peptide/nickel transport system permease protein